MTTPKEHPVTSTPNVNGEPTAMRPVRPARGTEIVIAIEEHEMAEDQPAQRPAGRHTAQGAKEALPADADEDALEARYRAYTYRQDVLMDAQLTAERRRTQTVRRHANRTLGLASDTLRNETGDAATTLVIIACLFVSLLLNALGATVGAAAVSAVLVGAIAVRAFLLVSWIRRYRRLRKEMTALSALLSHPVAR